MLTPTLFTAAALLANAPASLAEMQWKNRVLIVSAQRQDDPRLAEQHRTLEQWSAQARDRDLVIVDIIGNDVRGVDEPAATLRRRYALPASAFAAVLIGKDGGVKRRSRRPVDAAELQATIDAMPMRRSGGR